jgi:hypothetical protein
LIDLPADVLDVAERISASAVELISPGVSYVTVKVADAPEPCIGLGSASTDPLEEIISVASE